MAAEVALRNGVGTLVLDVRRGDGPPGCFNYTFASLAARTDLLKQMPEIGKSANRAICNTLQTLSADPSRATQLARPLFPQFATDIIADLIARDVPYYSAAITSDAIEGLSQFTIATGLAKREVTHAELVA